MPTGYTADVGDGKVTDFRTFALRCARQFGATIMQRDDPMDVPPKHREVSEYDVRAVADAEAELARVLGMTVEEAERAARAEYERRVAERALSAVGRRQTRERYERMLADVNAWAPPTSDHAALKTFMADQLRESIKWDCTDYGDAPVCLSGDVWLTERRKQASASVGRAHQRLAEERVRVASANQWIDALYASLPVEAPR